MLTKRLASNPPEDDVSTTLTRLRMEAGMLDLHISLRWSAGLYLLENVDVVDECDERWLSQPIHVISRNDVPLVPLP